MIERKQPETRRPQTRRGGTRTEGDTGHRQSKITRSVRSQRGRYEPDERLELLQIRLTVKNDSVVPLDFLGAAGRIALNDRASLGRATGRIGPFGDYLIPADMTAAGFQ